MSFKKNYERICFEKDLRPSVVCEKIGLSRSTYSLWTDASMPRKSTLEKLAAYLGVEVSDLIGTDPISEADAVAAELRAQASESAKKDLTPISREALMRDYLMSLYDRADEATREKMLQAAEGLLLGRPDLSKDGR